MSVVGEDKVLTAYAPAYYADLLAAIDLHGQTLQDKRELGPVPHGYLLKLDGSTTWPFRSGLILGHFMRCLLREPLCTAVLHHYIILNILPRREMRRKTYFARQSSCSSSDFMSGGLEHICMRNVPLPLRPTCKKSVLGLYTIHILPYLTGDSTADLCQGSWKILI